MSEVKDWAEKQPRYSPGTGSATLSYPEEVRTAIKEFCELRAAGKTQVPFTVFVEKFLRPKYNYTLTEAALRRYVKRYHSDLWTRIKNA